MRAGHVPKLRLKGALKNLDVPAIPTKEFERAIESSLSEAQWKWYAEHGSLDIGVDFDIKGDIHRFRVNIFRTRGRSGIAARRVSNEILNLEELYLPTAMYKLCELHHGLVLLCGVTGSGKSTTIAALLDHINKNRACHILTIEDPIEYLFTDKKAIINQREVGLDVPSFPIALRALVRENPDVVLIGEMRDKETIEAGLTLAETGHLTFATLHTSSAVETINRIVDVFPAYQQNQIRTQLAFVLEGVFCQQLLPKMSGRGRAMAAEIMIPNSAIRALIRDDKCHQILSHIQTGSKSGMATMNQSLFNLYKASLISWDDAMMYSSDQEDLKRTAQRDGM
jgi:twitching motility protein PilT